MRRWCAWGGRAGGIRRGWWGMWSGRGRGRCGRGCWRSWRRRWCGRRRFVSSIMWWRGKFARAVEELLKETGVGRGRIAVVASHGQTICHLPPGGKNQGARSRKQEVGRGMGGATLQIGDVSVLATLTEMRVVGNFRAADMAVGGQGAPLVPWADAMMFSDWRVARCVQNIGGIANVTWLPVARGPWSMASMRKVMAFDTGPGNMLLDAVVRMVTKGREGFDRDGRMAAGAGVCDVAEAVAGASVFCTGSAEVQRDGRSLGRVMRGGSWRVMRIGRCPRKIWCTP